MLLSAVWCYTPIKSNDTGFNSLNPVRCQGVFNSNREIMANLDFLHEGLKIHVCFHVREKRVTCIVSFKNINLKILTEAFPILGCGMNKCMKMPSCLQEETALHCIWCRSWPWTKVPWLWLLGSYLLLLIRDFFYFQVFQELRKSIRLTSAVNVM